MVNSTENERNQRVAGEVAAAMTTFATADMHTGYAENKNTATNEHIRLACPRTLVRAVN